MPVLQVQVTLFYSRSMGQCLPCLQDSFIYFEYHKNLCITLNVFIPMRIPVRSFMLLHTIFEVPIL